jgi:hypothetical protein
MKKIALFSLMTTLLLTIACSKGSSNGTTSNCYECSLTNVTGKYVENFCDTSTYINFTNYPTSGPSYSYATIFTGVSAQQYIDSRVKVGFTCVKK